MTVPTRLVADGGYSALDVTSATNLFTGPGTVYRVIVTATAANASSVIDSAATSATAGNTILTIPANTTQGTVYALNWPVTAGLSVVPGTSVILAVSYSAGQMG